MRARKPKLPGVERVVEGWETMATSKETALRRMLTRGWVVTSWTAYEVPC